MVQGHGSPAARGIALSVHGPAGVLDLLVPGGASAVDVAREYAARAGLPDAPLLLTGSGRPLPADRGLAEAGVGTGTVLVAVPHASGSAAARPAPLPSGGPVATPGPLATTWFSVAATAALLAGWLAGRGDPSAVRTVVALLLVVAAVIGAVPLGRYAGPRALAAPAFGAGAALAVVWDPHPERLPVVLGTSALAGAVTGAAVRVLAEAEEGLRVWTVAGSGVFGTAALAALLGLPATVTWAVLLAAAVLAARYVPAVVVDVPDQLLLDLDRLAVTAWSARDRPRGGRGRAVVSPSVVAGVARRGARLVTAACVAVAGTAVVSSGLLLATVTPGLDRTGARFLVLFAGGALLLAGRSYRHAAARAMLRVAGLGCWTWLSAELLAGPGTAGLLAGSAIGVAAALVVAAVATGRGWRSAWWARRAEVAESVCGAAALASVLVATGFFRVVWDIGSRVGG